jgi:hypothetical protein
MAEEKPGTTSTPVYVPFATFLTAVDALKRDGIPGTGKIDKSLWDSQSGAIQGQLLIAFRFLGLIDEHNRVLSALPPLVSASADDRKPIIKKLIEASYSKLLTLDLNTISQGQLDEAMRGYGVGGSTLIRAVRFFVKACQETGIPISKRVSEKVRGGSSGPRKRRAPSGARTPVDPPPITTSPADAPSTAWEAQLLAKFPAFDPAWPDELKTQWFAGFGRLMESKPK